MKIEKGFTIIEIMMVTVLLGISAVAVGYSFVVGLRLFNSSYNRALLKGDVSTAFERVSEVLRSAKSIDALSASSITFTADLGQGDQSHRFYLYNALDLEPNPPYSQETYELRWAQQDITYGAGAVLARNIALPEDAVFSRNGNLINLSWAVSKEEQTITFRSKVRPRNL